MAKFNKGDKVRVKTLDGYSDLKAEFFEVGGIYEVVRHADGMCGGNVYFDESESLGTTLLADDLELVTEANAMTTFKKGDVVVTVDKVGWAVSGQGLVGKGAVGKVKAVNGDKLTVKFGKKQPLHGAAISTRKNFVVRTSEIRLATAEEAASIAKKKAEQPTFKVGDKVRMLSDSLYGKKYKGKTGVVSESADEDGDISITPDGGGACGLFKADSLELLTETTPVTPQANEEITSDETLSFEGAKYRKVDRKAQAGDVVVLTGVKDEKTVDGQPYAVYNDRGDFRYRNGKSHGNLVYGWNTTCPNPDVYEKVEAEYVPQEGDIVVVTANDFGSRNSVGDIGKITEVLSYKIVVDVPSKSEGLGGFGNGHGENEVRKATPAEVEAYEKALHKASFSVGDYVKVVKSERGNEGKIVKITKVADGERHRRLDGTLELSDFIGQLVGDSQDYGFLAGQFAKATEQEVADATKPKLKVGDFVTIESTTYVTDITPGKAYEVRESYVGLYFEDDGGDFRYRPLEVGAYTIVDADEAKWAKIGRKVGEFYKGDSVFVTHPDGGKIYGIIHEYSSGRAIKVDFGKRFSICTEKKSDLTLVAPVESTLK